MDIKDEIKLILNSFIETQAIAYTLENKQNPYKKILYGQDDRYYIACIRKITHVNYGANFTYCFTIRISKLQNLVKVKCTINSALEYNIDANNYIYRKLFVKLNKEGFKNNTLLNEYTSQYYYVTNKLEVVLDTKKSYSDQLIKLITIINLYNDFMFEKFYNQYHEQRKF